MISTYLLCATGLQSAHHENGIQIISAELLTPPLSFQITAPHAKYRLQ